VAEAAGDGGPDEAMEVLHSERVPQGKRRPDELSVEASLSISNSKPGGGLNTPALGTIEMRQASAACGKGTGSIARGIEYSSAPMHADALRRECVRA